MATRGGCEFRGRGSTPGCGEPGQPHPETGAGRGANCPRTRDREGQEGPEGPPTPRIRAAPPSKSILPSPSVSATWVTASASSSVRGAMDPALGMADRVYLGPGVGSGQSWGSTWPAPDRLRGACSPRDSWGNGAGRGPLSGLARWRLVGMPRAQDPPPRLLPLLDLVPLDEAALVLVQRLERLPDDALQLPRGPELLHVLQELDTAEGNWGGPAVSPRPPCSGRAAWPAGPGPRGRLLSRGGGCRALCPPPARGLVRARVSSTVGGPAVPWCLASAGSRSVSSSDRDAPVANAISFIWEEKLSSILALRARGAIGRMLGGRWHPAWTLRSARSQEASEPRLLVACPLEGLPTSQQRQALKE